jgi:aminoglycoside phosphotransferase family enzyme/predicted kinase
MTRPTWLSELLEPGAYPGSPRGPVELIQTHASFVFRVGSDVYKLKKSVRTPFLDYSTAEIRRWACEEEVRVNRPLAPGIYLGTLPVVEDPRTGAVRVGGDGKRLDTVVHMRRIPDDDLLSARVINGRATRDTLRSVALRVAEFHAQAERSAEVDRASRPEVIERLLLGNLEECRRYAGSLVSTEVLAAVAQFFRAAVALFEKAIEDRVREGRAVDGHGDLRLEHVSLEQDPPAILDRIEFDPTFRYGDVALDLSFLVLELREAVRVDLARVLVEAYVASARDPQLAAMLDLCCAHRALVRAKVHGIRSEELEVAPEERGRSADRARRLFSLARLLTRPLWVATTGLPGSGKSTVAQSVASHLDPEACLRTDTLRHGIPPGERYTPEGIARVYHRLRERAVERSREGRWSVLDATFGDRSERAEIEEAAGEAGADLLWIECSCPEAVAVERLERRASLGADPSEADRSVRSRLAHRYQAPDEIPRNRCLELSTVEAPGELALRVRRWAFGARPVRVLQVSEETQAGDGE